MQKFISILFLLLLLLVDEHVGQLTYAQTLMDEHFSLWSSIIEVYFRYMGVIFEPYFSFEVISYVTTCSSHFDQIVLTLCQLIFNRLSFGLLSVFLLLHAPARIRTNQFTNHSIVCDTDIGCNPITKRRRERERNDVLTQPTSLSLSPALYIYISVHCTSCRSFPRIQYGM